MKSLLARRLERMRGPHDSAYGIEYNGVISNRWVSADVYSFDIARTPHVVSDLFDRKDVQGKAYKANSKRRILDKYYNKVMGRM
jgi:hypothetical protein